MSRTLIPLTNRATLRTVHGAEAGRDFYVSVTNISPGMLGCLLGFLPLKYFIKPLLDLYSCQPTCNMCLHKDSSTYPCPNVETLTYVDNHIVYCEMAGLSTPGLWAHRRKSCGDPAYRCVPTHGSLKHQNKHKCDYSLSTITH